MSAWPYLQEEEEVKRLGKLGNSRITSTAKRMMRSVVDLQKWEERKQQKQSELKVGPASCCYRSPRHRHAFQILNPRFLS